MRGILKHGRNNYPVLLLEVLTISGELFIYFLLKADLFVAVGKSVEF